MGKGDKRTKRGKIVRGTYGKSRPKTQTESKTLPKKRSQKSA